MKLDCQIAEAASEIEIQRCFSVMVQLRPHLAEHEFVQRVRALMKSGFRLAAARVEASTVAVAGFRLADNLFHGKFLYIDDLVTDADSRSKGYGAQLFRWLVQLAAAENCTTANWIRVCNGSPLTGSTSAKGWKSVAITSPARSKSSHLQAVGEFS